MAAMSDGSALRLCEGGLCSEGECLSEMKKVVSMLIFQFSPSFGTEALVPLVAQFWFLLLDTRVSVQGFQGVICICLMLLLVWFHFSSRPFRLQKSGGT